MSDKIVANSIGCETCTVTIQADGTPMHEARCTIEMYREELTRLHIEVEAAIAAQDAIRLHHGMYALPHAQAIRLFDALNAYRHPETSHVVMVSPAPGREEGGTP